MAPWADLPPDLLRDVSGRLHNAIDFTRFHAVCTAWRDALPTPPCSLPAFLPFLLTFTACQGSSMACDDRLILHTAVNFSPERMPRSRYCYEGVHIMRPPGESSLRNWLTSTDGTAAWPLTTDTGAGLHDPFTGVFTPLPAYQHERRRMENPGGNICCDGTVFLYNIFSGGSTGKLLFRAAVLRPGDTTWTLMKTKLDHLPHISKYNGITVVYHNDKILVCLGSYWCILTFEDDGASRRLKPMPWIDRGNRYSTKTCYALEFQGQLLWVTVLVHASYTRERPMLSLCVLFLDSRASFAVDAAQLGLDSGCAYFIFSSNDGATLCEHLPSGWPADNTWDVYWLRPQPTIAPIQEIRKRLGLQKRHPRDSFVGERYIVLIDTFILLS
ncbi:hypothetical protein VPH35_126232 [Triticum aestivum]